MKKALWMALLVLTALQALPGYAEINGHDLLRQCNEAVKSFSATADPATLNFVEAERCKARIDGFAGAAAFYEGREGAPGAICFPDNGSMTFRQSIPMVVQHLEDHPEQLQDSATILIFGTFLSNYPCK